MVLKLSVNGPMKDGWIWECLHSFSVFILIPKDVSLEIGKKECYNKACCLLTCPAFRAVKRILRKGWVIMASHL